jgi:type IV secretory pathway VirB10-like protein
MTDLAEEVTASSSAINWTHVGLGLLAIGAFFALAKLVITPVEPEITLVQPSTIQPAPIRTAPVNPTQSDVIEEASAPSEPSQPEQEAIDEIAPSAVNEKKVKQTQKTAEQKTVKQKSAQQKVAAPAMDSTPEKTSPGTTENKAAVNTPDKQMNRKVDKENVKEKSGWQTFKDSVTTGAKPKCTQAEIALNQCSK